MSLSTRSGLAELGADGDKLTAASYNQGRYHGLALARVVAELLGGEGIYTGGATVVGDLTGSGANYPAFRAVVYDDNGEAWLFNPTSATTMTFTDTSGACTAYLVVKQQAGISPASAIGGRADFQIVAQLTASAAPAHSLVLGAGSVTASKFTTWTPDASVFVAAGASIFARLTLANTFTALNTFSANLRIKDGGTHYATLAAATHAADRTYTLPDAGAAANVMLSEGTQTSNAANTFTARQVYANGLLNLVRDTKYGPPTSGAHIIGDLHMDLAGAIWRCTADGTPGTWVQQEFGTTGTGALGEAWASFVTTSHWNGSALLNGYRVYETDTGAEWTYVTAGSLNRWVGQSEKRHLGPYTGWVAAGYSASTSWLLATVLTGQWDVLVDRFDYYAITSGDASTNYWDLNLVTSTGTIATATPVYQNANGYANTTAAGPYTSANHYLALHSVKRASAGNLTYLTAAAIVRPVHL